MKSWSPSLLCHEVLRALGFPEGSAAGAHAQCAHGRATAFPSSEALAELCGGMAALLVVFSPLPRLRGLLQRCWGRLERGLLPGFSGGQSPPWGRYWPAPLPAEGEGGIGAAGRIFTVERRREGAGAGECAALGNWNEGTRLGALLAAPLSSLWGVSVASVSYFLGCTRKWGLAVMNYFFCRSGPALAVQAPAFLPEPVSDTRESNEAPSLLDSILWMAAPKKRRTIEVNRCRRRNPNKLIKVKVIIKFPQGCHLIRCK